MCVCVCVYVYIYIYRERERERERGGRSAQSSNTAGTCKLNARTHIVYVRKISVSVSDPDDHIFHKYNFNCVWGRGEVYTGFWCGNVREGDHLEDPGVDGKILRWIFRKWDGGRGLD